jgi:hypothetical protein
MLVLVDCTVAAWCIVPHTFIHDNTLSVFVEHPVSVTGCGSPWWWWGEWCSFHTEPPCGCSGHFTLCRHPDAGPPDSHSNPLQWRWGRFISTHWEWCCWSGCTTFTSWYVTLECKKFKKRKNEPFSKLLENGWNDVSMWRLCCEIHMSEMMCYGWWM